MDAQPRAAASAGGRGAPAESEAAKEAKYAEIRDAETDFHAGKLSPEDYRELDRALRAEAIRILEQIDRVNEESSRGDDRPS